MCMFYLLELRWDYVTHASWTDLSIKCWLNIKTFWFCEYWQGRRLSLPCIYTPADWISGWLGKNSKQRWCKILNTLFLLEMRIVQPRLSGSEPRFLEDFHKDKVLCVCVCISDQVCFQIIYAFVVILFLDLTVLSDLTWIMSYLFFDVARRCEFLPLQGRTSLHVQWPVLSGHTTPCWRGGIRAGAPQGISPRVWATAHKTADWDEGGELSSGQGPFLLSSAGSW